MKLILLDNILEFSNKEETIEDIFNSINETLVDSNYLLSHLRIDGIEIYDDYEEYILENIEFIEEIQVEVKKLKELIEEVLMSTKGYIQRAIPLVEQLGETFYQTPKENSWQNLADLFEGIQWMLQAFSNIDGKNHLEEIVPSYELWNEYVQQVFRLSQKIPDLQEAVENKDYILIGDLLTYEIQSIFMEMLDKLQRMIPEVVEDNYVN